MSSSPTPFTPPTTEEERLAFLRLIRSRRVGPATFHRLIDSHGTPAAALAALPAVARAAGEEGYAPCPATEAAAELAQGRALGARPLFFGAADYPAPLADLPDAPPLLWLLGDPALLARPMVALVGMRNASSLGLRMARRLAEGLGAEGFVVVSGLARGVDAAAHAAALATGTAAVVAGGIDIVYPAENAALAAEIAARGALLSEHPPGLAPQARHFPTRNRIVAGLALGVIVVEAADRSGSLITARAALDQARVVMAVPGHPLDPRAAGTNALLREGAVLVRDAGDAAAALAAARAAQAAEAAARARATAAAPRAAAATPAAGTAPAVAPTAGAGRAPATAALAGPAAAPPTAAPAGAARAPVPTAAPAGAASAAAAALSRPAAAGGPPASAPAARAAPAPAPSALAEPAAAAPPAARRSPAPPAAPPGTGRSPAAAAAIAAARDLHRLILDRLGTAPLAEDQLLRDLALPPAAVAPALLDLELDGRIARQAGGLLARLH